MLCSPQGHNAGLPLSAAGAAGGRAHSTKPTIEITLARTAYTLDTEEFSECLLRPAFAKPFCASNAYACVSNCDVVDAAVETSISLTLEYKPELHELQFRASGLQLEPTFSAYAAPEIGDNEREEVIFVTISKLLSNVPDELKEMDLATYVRAD